MYHPVPMTDDVYWIGVNDRETDLFEAMWPLPHGISYNSYLMIDEKVALIDCIHKDYAISYLDRLERLLPKSKDVDYLIINHMEPDHSGAIKMLVRSFPHMKVVGNKKTMDMLSAYYGLTENVHVVGDGDVLDLGRHKLKFYLTPMVHWPETMMTHDETEKILFSGDAFGGFRALDGGLFDDELNTDAYEYETLRYYANIIGKFSIMVQKALEKLKGLDVRMVAPTHGPVWRKDPKHIIGLYDQWSRQEPGAFATVAYGSMYTNTKNMAEAAATGLVQGGVKDVVVYNTAHAHLSYMLADAWRSRGMILGSCTYNTKMFPRLWHLTGFLEDKMMKNRSLGIFGSYGWTGGAVKELRAFAERSKWNLVEPVVEAKGSPNGDALKQCEELGRNLAKVILEGAEAR